MNKRRASILFTIILSGLYFFRITLVEFIFNAVLDKHQIQVVNLQGLKVGSKSISIDAMILVLGKNRAEQRFEGLALDYSTAFSPIKSLYVRAASLSIPEFGATENSAEPLMLSDLLSLLVEPPLQSLKIESLKISGRTIRLEWQRSGHEQILRINDAEHESKLKLVYQGHREARLEWRLLKKNKVIATIDLDLKKNGDKYLLAGSQFVQIDPILDMLKPYIAKWPEHAEKIRGTLAFELQTELENNLRIFDRKQLDLSVIGKLQIPSLTTRGFKIRKLNAQIQGQLSIGKPTISLQLSPGEILKVHFIGISDLKITNLKVQTETDGKIIYEPRGENLQLEQKRLHVDLPQVKTSKLKLSPRLEINDLQFHNGDHTNTSFRIKTDNVRLEMPGQWIPSLGFHSKIVLKNQRLSIDGSLVSKTQKTLLDFSARHNLDTNVGAGHVSTELAFDSNTNKISQYFPPWPFSWDVQSGRFHAKSDLKWWRNNHEFKFSGTFEQSFNQLSGHYNDIVFIGLDGAFSGKYGPANLLASTKPWRLSINTLDIGLPVKDIHLSFSIDSSRNRSSLHTFDARLLGGKVDGQDFAYQPQLRSNPLLLNIHRIQLKELLSLAAFETVHANGAISGKLPITISPRGISMEQGRLAVEKPGGVIRYRPDSSAKIAAATNPAIRIAIEALSNYHYETLEADAQYSTNGDLTLQMKMQGLNPNMNNGQRIDLNLNVSDNIPTLLRSLQSGRMITDVLEKKLIQ